MEDTERIWIQEAEGGDQAAFTRLVEAYQTPVYNLAYRLLGDPSEAEDAAQETFVRVYRHLNTYDPERKFSSWLLAITSHYCVDLLRRRHMDQVSMDDLPPMMELAMPSSTQPEQVVVHEQEAHTVQQLLGRLEPSYRIPVVLRYWYDMSYQEIATALGVNESTIKTRLHRARARLAEIAQSATAQQAQRCSQ
jgi:RNA polymerase sigma-70 factor (ECF subfamily)